MMITGGAEQDNSLPTNSTPRQLDAEKLDADMNRDRRLLPKNVLKNVPSEVDG